MRIGFIGLGNVGAKLAGSLLRNGFDLVVRDLDRGAARALLDGGAAWADSPRRAVMSVSIIPGATTLTVIPRLATSRAKVFENPTMPALVAA